MWQYIGCLSKAVGTACLPEQRTFLWVLRAFCVIVVSYGWLLLLIIENDVLSCMQDWLPNCKKAAIVGLNKCLPLLLYLLVLSAKLQMQVGLSVGRLFALIPYSV